MGVLVPVVIAGSVAGGMVSIALAGVAWEYRKVPSALPFGVMMLAIAVWSFANAALLASEGPRVAFVADRILRAATVQVAPLWLLFVLTYVGAERWVDGWTVAALWAVPVAAVLAVATAPLHGLASTPDEVVILTVGGATAPHVPRGVLTLATNIYSYALAAAGLLLLVRFLLRSRAVYRKQTAVLIGAGFVAIAAAVASDFGLVAHPGVDVAPLSFVVAGCAIGWALLRYGLLQLTPLAENVLIDELPDPVFVLGDDDRVIDDNPAAVETFDHDDPSGEPLDDIAPGLASHLEDDKVFRHGEGTGGDADVTYYEPSVTELRDQHGTVRGRLVVLRDITGQQRRQDRLEALQEATRRFLGASTDEQVAEIAVEYTEGALSCDAAGVFLVDDERALRPAAMSDHALELFDREELVVAPDDGYAAYQAYESGERAELTLEVDVGGPIEQLTFLPLGDLGILAAGTTADDGFAPDEVGFATILARTTHVALERVERESELRQSRKALERRTEQIAFFNGVLRHSLRNALLVIEGRAEHLRSSLPESEQDHVDTIVRWCADLADLNENIRSVNDTVTATESERLDAVDLSGLLWDRLEAYEERYPDATFEIDVDDGVSIKANELARSVVDSIVDNAVVHNDSETPRIEIWTVSAADRVQVHVADNGPGITDEMKSIVFERSVTSTQTASGFGLYFVSVLVNLYGGNLRFEDNDPEGSVAVLEFQLSAIDEDGEEVIRESDGAVEATGVAAGGPGDAKAGFDVVSGDGGNGEDQDVVGDHGSVGSETARDQEGVGEDADGAGGD